MRLEDTGGLPMVTNAIANLLSSIQRQITIPPILTPYGETDGKIFCC